VERPSRVDADTCFAGNGHRDPYAAYDHEVVDPTVFERRAEVYQRARPPYPDDLFTRFGELGLLTRQQRVLDVGAGTGTASETFVRAGSHVTAVEPGKSLAELLAQRVPEATIIRSTFEDAHLPSAAFDVAVCATAFHWLDLPLALPKLHLTLVPGGQLAVWWNVFGDPTVDTLFRAHVAQIVAGRSNPPTRRPDAADVEWWTGTLTTGGYFDVTHTEQFNWSIDLSALQVRELFSTFSDWSDAEVQSAAAAVDDLGGTVTEHYSTVLYVAKRRSSRCQPSSTHLRP
jgi:SAM-dependent methyltransferase